MPSITTGPHESHPFSFANVPNGPDTPATFILRVHSGATKLLRDALTQSTETSFLIYMEGPYGVVHDLNDKVSVLLFAGALAGRF